MSEDSGASEPVAAPPEPAATPRPHAVRPRFAASMLLIDRSGPEPTVLLGRRNAALKFLPNKYAFPGGRLEPDDRAMVASGCLRERCIDRLQLRRRNGSPPPQAFALAAIRELFEETGLLLGAKAQANSKAAIPPAWQAFTDLGFTPNLAPLTYFARAITPPSFPRRFDTSFFLLDASEIAHRIHGYVSDDTELVELVWLPFAEAGQRDVPKITAMILLELEARIKAGFPDTLPVPFFYERNRRWIREELA